MRNSLTRSELSLSLYLTRKRVVEYISLSTILLSLSEMTRSQNPKQYYIVGRGRDFQTRLHRQTMPLGAYLAKWVLVIHAFRREPLGAS